VLYLEFFATDGGILHRMTMPAANLDEVERFGLLTLQGTLKPWAPNLPPVVGFTVRDANLKSLYEWRAMTDAPKS
jgi:hypothetical protein